MTTDTTNEKQVPTPEAQVPVAQTEAQAPTPQTPAETQTKTPAAKDRPATALRARRARTPRSGRGRERPRSEFDQVTIEVRRVARVMAGGRRFSFSVTVVIGDRKGRVGVGLGKGSDTALAVEKAARNARRHLLTVCRTDSGSIPHTVTAKYVSSEVTISPSAGRGIVAGSAMRTVLELAGVTDVVAKILSRSKNKLTISRATVKALSMLAGKPAKSTASAEAAPAEAETAA